MCIFLVAAAARLGVLELQFQFDGRVCKRKRKRPNEKQCVSIGRCAADPPETPFLIRGILSRSVLSASVCVCVCLQVSCRSV